MLKNYYANRFRGLRCSACLRTRALLDPELGPLATFFNTLLEALFPNALTNG
jgi:hypothetical protein